MTREQAQECLQKHFGGEESSHGQFVAKRMQDVKVKGDRISKSDLIYIISQVKAP